jgi:hypothetical protein
MVLERTVSFWVGTLEMFSIWGILEYGDLWTKYHENGKGFIIFILLQLIFI